VDTSEGMGILVSQRGWEEFLHPRRGWYSQTLPTPLPSPPSVNV